jgi:beta-glucosidase
VVEFEVPAKALAFVGADGRWRLEAGDIRLAIGGLGQIVTCTKTKVWDTPNI